MMEVLSEKPLTEGELIDKSIDELKRATRYLTKVEQKQLIESCYFAATAHQGQYRRSGEPYVCHPIKVAEILAKEVAFDLAVLQAAVLHDVIEDTNASKEDVTAQFGEEVAELVDGVSKLEKDADVCPQVLQARTFAKLVQAMAKDPRVVMIKFADRMHNMQTLSSLRRDKQRRIAKETLEVYVPIATRLGMYAFKSKLENLSFKFLYPWRYKTIQKVLKTDQPRRKIITKVQKKITEAIRELDINAEVLVRNRNIYDTYLKIEESSSKKLPLETASIPFILITDDIDNCYRLLGVVHRLYPPIFRHLVDYIASPKSNGYQSIHTSALTNQQQLITFQIRTQGMHTVAQGGIIAIWREYNKIQLSGNRADKSMRRWLGNMKNLQSLINNPVEYYEAAKRDLMEDDMQVYTPKGDAVTLPTGATVVDFAYQIHTEVGDKLVSAKVNGVPVGVDFILTNGQAVEVYTRKDAHPHASWLKKVKTAHARAAIRRFFRSIPEQDRIKIGRASFINFLKRKNYYPIDNLQQKIEQVCLERGISESQLFEMIALDEAKKTDLLENIKKLVINHGDFVSQIVVEVDNLPGVLADVATTIGQSSVNIEGIGFPENMRAAQVKIQFSIRMTKLEHLDDLLLKIEKLNLVRNVTLLEKQ